MDNAPGASPRRYGSPIAMTLQYQDKACRYYRRIAGATASIGGRAGKKGGIHQREMSRRNVTISFDYGSSAKPFFRDYRNAGAAQRRGLTRERKPPKASVR